VSGRTAGVAVLVGALAFGGAAGAAVTTVERPATASETADRMPANSPIVGGCTVFPSDNAWNQDVSQASLHPNSAAIIATIQGNGGTRLHPDFGENPEYGIPFVVVPGDQPLVPITYTAYGDESDRGPFPVPVDAPVEGGDGSTGDRHVLVLRADTCDLFELYRAFRSTNGWRADSGARFDLRSNALRPLGWTSADAAGLPILPGLVRYEEVATGEIEHAIRVTFSKTRRGYVLPATHFASSDDNTNLPPMGMRLRLEASFDTSQLAGQARVIAVAMQRYGLIVADNGSDWFVSGAPHPRWDNDQLRVLGRLTGRDFEVVDTSALRR
jgi:hypothetical protein